MTRLNKSGIYIKRLRKEVGLTQTKFAEKLNLAQSNISDLENDKYDISVSKFIHFCEVLGYSDYNKILSSK